MLKGSLDRDIFSNVYSVVGLVSFWKGSSLAAVVRMYFRFSLFTLV